MRSDVLPALDAGSQTVVIWLSDGISNIDILGRGPEGYELEELQSIDLRDPDGSFRSWGEVGWSGDFNGTLGTFDGEPLANTMFQIERLAASAPGALFYGLGLAGDGVDLGTFNPGLLDYSAHVSGGRSFAAAGTAELLASVRSLVSDLRCGAAGSAVLGGRIWHDRNGDGLPGADTSASGEPGLPAVSIGLFDAVGDGLAQTSSGSGGTFVFGELAAGTYSVQVDATTLPVGESGEVIDGPTYDLDGISSVDTVTLSVGEGEVRGDVSFGYREREPAPPAEICAVETFDGPALDPSWQVIEIGDADQGSAAVVDGALHLSSDGTSLFHGPDHGTFVTRGEAGDFRVEVRVAGVPGDTGGPVRKGCLMARAGFASEDPRLMVCYIPHLPDAATQAIQFDVRRENGVEEEVADLVINAVLPVWLSIEREGGVYRVAYSLDQRQTWIRPTGRLEGEVELDLGSAPWLGSMVASYDADVVMTMSFDDFEVCRPNPEAP